MTDRAAAADGSRAEEEPLLPEACDEEGLPGAADVAAYCRELSVERGASEHTVRAYRVDLTDYLRWASRHGIDPLHVGHKQLRGYLAELDQARYARTTVNRRLSSVRGFYRWLNLTGRSSEDPAAALQGPKAPKSLPKVIKPADMARLLSVHAERTLDGTPREQTLADMRDQAILEFLYACGARVSEASGLLFADVDLAGRQVKVLGKGSKERIVPVHDLAVRSMRRWADIARPAFLEGRRSEFFFVSSRGRRMSPDAIRKMFKDAVRAAGLDEGLSPHAMRHTFATDLLSGGADLRSVQEMLGHASLSTTQVYTHVTPSRLREVHRRAHPRS